MKRWTTVALVLLAAGAPLAAADKPLPDLDKAISEMASYKFGQSRAALIAVGKHVMSPPKSPAERKKLAGRLAGMLASDATTDCKRFICRQLSLIGTDETVPALAPLLRDKELSHMARYALERIPGEPASAALRKALGDTSGSLRVGVINSVAARRDARALDAIVGLAGDADKDVALAAVAAMGRIGGEAAAGALARVRPGDAKMTAELTDAMLRCADGMLGDGKSDAAGEVYRKLYVPAQSEAVRIAALRGLVAVKKDRAAPLVAEALTGDDAALRSAAIRHVRTMPGKGLAAAFADLIEKVPADTKVGLIDALGGRGDRLAAPAVMRAAKDPDEAVRTAALRAIGRLGGPRDVAMLARAAAGSGPPADAARESLARLPGEGVGKALADQLAAGAAGVKVQVIRAMVARGTTGVVGALMGATRDADKAVRVEALKAMGALAGQKDIPVLVRLVLQADGAEQDAARAMLSSVCRRMSDRDQAVAPVLGALSGADVPARCALLRTLGAIGGDKARAAIRKAAKDANADVRDAAVRGLADWPDASAAADLLAMARTAKELKHRVLAFRGLIRVVGLPSEREPAETLKLYKDAMAAAPRAEEKKLALAGIAKVASAAAVEALAACLDQAGLKSEAAAAIFRLAGDKGFRKSGANKKALRAALTKIQNTAGDKKTVAKAKRLFQQVK